MRKLLLQILQNSTAMPFTRWGNTYKCFFCQKNFQKASDLKNHTTTHVDLEQKFRTVNRCGDGLRSFIKLDVTQLKCNTCDSEFNSLRNFLTHLTEVHNEKLDMEPLKYIDSYKLTDGEMKCLICDENFQYFNQLLLHTLRMHKVRQFICEICGVNYATKKSLSKHYQSAHETNQKTYTCNQCGKNFATLHKRVNHEKRIHDMKASTCDICNQILGSAFKKATHMANVHNVRQSEFKCDNCPKVFLLASQLHIHNRRMHMKERTKVCDVCGDKFFDDHHLKLHKVKHSDAKPYECDICMKKFPRKKALVLHTKIHTGDKTCVCQVCGEAFVQTTSLKLHVRVHHGIGKKQSK
ncbi:zinc finger protein 287-like [Cydia strobilella]|uniref:zinc finger protein 287-like n=1 Tax=Cydia strobilella TaxID=1100964 RepID=UPI003007BDEF